MIRSVSPSLMVAQHDTLVPVEDPYRQCNYRLVISTPVTPDRAEAPIAALVLPDRGEEVGAAKVGPEDVGEDQLGVGELPQQEVRDPILAGGSHQHVGVGHVGRVQVAAQDLLVDAARGKRPRGGLLGDGPGGVEQLGPTP